MLPQGGPGLQQVAGDYAAVLVARAAVLLARALIAADITTTTGTASQPLGVSSTEPTAPAGNSPSGARGANGVQVLQTVNNDVKGEIEADEVLLSIGRVPNVEELSLDKAGIVVDPEQGIKVDDFLRTTNPDVYSAGDVCLDLKFTNAAQASARIAVRNALSGGQERQSRLVIPWCTYCDPEIAHIGVHVWEARLESIPIKSYTVMMQDVDRAITDHQDNGFVKLHVAEGSDRILGATIVAPRASEMINEVCVAMCGGLGLRESHDVPLLGRSRAEANSIVARINSPGISHLVW